MDKNESAPGPSWLEAPLLFESAVLPFVERARAGRQNFSLLEIGSWSGLYSLEIASRYPSSTLLVIEPNRTLWEAHTALAHDAQLPNVLCLHNPIAEDVAEALAHSNEFVDMQLLLGLHSVRPFDHGAEVNTERRERLNRYLASHDRLALGPPTQHNHLGHQP